MDTETITRASSAGEVQVKHFRQILLWPVYLMPETNGSSLHDRWPDVNAVTDALPPRK